MNDIENMNVDLAVEKLLSGDVVAFPTETVYGLGACINNESALKKIFSVKERPFFDPLIVHVASISEARGCFDVWNDLAQSLAEKFWPGPLTIVMKKSNQISDLITSGLESVGVRYPNHPVALQLIRKVGCPIAAPSANKFGKTSPTHAEHVRKEFENSVYVLDEGSSEIGIESTVLLVKECALNVYEIAILRKGAILKSELNHFLLTKNFNFSWIEEVSKKESPGHMKHHYMPEIPFVICRNPKLKLSELIQILNNKLSELPDIVESVKIVKPVKKIEKIEFLNLSKNPYQAARELYSQLRSASERKPEVLCFIQTSEHNSEMWESVFDRLYKAASLIID